MGLLCWRSSLRNKRPDLTHLASILPSSRRFKKKERGGRRPAFCCSCARFKTPIEPNRMKIYLLTWQKANHTNCTCGGWLEQNTRTRTKSASALWQDAPYVACVVRVRRRSSFPSGNHARPTISPAVVHRIRSSSSNVCRLKNSRTGSAAPSPNVVATPRYPFGADARRCDRLDYGGDTAASRRSTRSSSSGTWWRHHAPRLAPTLVILECGGNTAASRGGSTTMPLARTSVVLETRRVGRKRSCAKRESATVSSRVSTHKIDTCTPLIYV